MKSIIEIGKYVVATDKDGYIVYKKSKKKDKKGNTIKLDIEYPSSLEYALKLLSEKILKDRFESDDYIPTIDGFRKTLSEHFKTFDKLTRGL